MFARPLFAALTLGFVALVSAGQAPDTRFTPPPGEESGEIRGLIDRAQVALAAGRSVTDLLTDEAFLPARAWPRFRALIRDRAPVGSVALAPASEPGEKLRVRGTVRDAAGRAVSGALLYVYQTSAKGWYAAEAAHIGGHSGDERHARLFAYLKTDAEGQYELRTIRPAGYPSSELPAHLHVELRAGSSVRVTEIVFDDDPRLTPAWRERSRHSGFVIAAVRRDAGGQEIEADFVIGE